MPVEMKLTVFYYTLCIFLLVFQNSVCGTLKDVELIPKEIRKIEDLRSLLNLKFDSGDKLNGRNFGVYGVENIEFDQLPSGSELLGPSIDLGYRDFGKYVSEKQVYGDVNRGDDLYGEQRSSNGRGEIGFFGTKGHEAATGQASEESFGGNQKHVHSDAADAGFYGDSAGAHKSQNIGRLYGGGKELVHKGLAAASVKSQGAHRKGHHSSGFHNSYHKDESGNNTSFYDDAVDDGGHFFLDSRGGAYADQLSDLYGGGYYDGAFMDHERGQKGNHDVSHRFDEDSGHKQNYGSGLYYDKNRDYGHEARVKNVHGGQGVSVHNGGIERYNQEDQGQGSTYYDGYKNPHYITYSDPAIPRTDSLNHYVYYPPSRSSYISPSDHISTGRSSGVTVLTDNTDLNDAGLKEYLKPQKINSFGYYGTYRGVAY